MAEHAEPFQSAPSDESDRLAALDSYGILDTAPEAGFDDIVTLACQICDTPVALVSLVAEDRQWFKANVGFALCETPLDQSVCAHALRQPGLLVIPDLTLDPRTAANGLVTGEPHIRFYAGARLETPEGLALGTLCVIDSKPRPEGLTRPQANALEALARQVMAQMNLRRTAAARDRAQVLNELILDCSDDCITVLDLDGRTQFVSPGGIRSMEIGDVDAILGSSWLRVWSGADHEAATAALAAARTGGTGHFRGYCPTHRGTPKWWDVIVSPLPGTDGKPERLVTVGRDITASRRAELQLAQSDERLKLALGASGMVGIWDWDLKADVVYADPNFARIYTVDPLRAAQGAPLSDYIKNFHPDDMPAFEAELARVFAGAPEFSNEYRIRQPDGSYRWVLARGRLVRDADGTPSRFPGASIDITERKEEEARRLSVLHLGDRFREMDDPAAMAFVAAEMMGRTLGASRAGYGTVDPVAERVEIARDWTAPGIESIAGSHAFRDFGSFIDDLKQGVTIAIDDVDRDCRTASGSEALEGIGVRSIVNIPVIEQGRFVAVFYVHGNAVRHWTPEEIDYLRNVADRTRTAVERRNAEERLRDLNDVLERRVKERTRERNRVWETTSDLMAIAGLDGYLQVVNPAWTDVLGWSASELRASPFMTFIVPADHGATLDVMARLGRNETVSGFVDHVLRKDGAERTIMWTAVPEGDRFYIVGRDLTEQRLVEEQLRQSQKMEAVGQLTGGVAHDFNNLLTVIRSSVDLLKRPNLTDERRLRYIEAISDTTTRAAKLTGQLLAFARRQALQPEVFDVGASVRQMGDMVATLVGSRIRIETQVSDAACFIDADPSQFETALVNLAVNARDAMGAEGTLTIATSPVSSIPAMRSHPELTGSFVAVSITDTGSGIAPDNISRIFEPFFTTKGVGQGTGLGLSQVFGFVKQSGGEVAVESESGRGTTFTLFLPQAAAAAVESRREAVASPEPRVDGHGFRVLVVEDNADVGSFANQSLQELGFETVLAVDAGKALQTLATYERRFDVVFSDVVMPGMNGIELGQEIRRRYPDIPVVLTSGYSHVLAENGTDGFDLLQKPYSVEDLSRTLLKAAHRRETTLAS